MTGTAASTGARPITATASTRRASAISGSNTCAERHERHLPRRGRITTAPANPRGDRRRANPQRLSTPSHLGQAVAACARSVSTRSGTFSTLSTMPSRHHRRAPSCSAKRQARGSLREQDFQTLSSAERHGKHNPPLVLVLRVVRRQAGAQPACRSTPGWPPVHLHPFAVEKRRVAFREVLARGLGRERTSRRDGGQGCSGVRLLAALNSN